MPYYPPAASAGANTALSNLASVAINLSLISDTNNTDSLGSSTIFWLNAYISNVYVNTTARLVSVGTTGAAIYGTGNFYIGDGTYSVFLDQTSVSNKAFYPDTSAALQLGRSDRYWDITWTEEIVLSNLGAAAAAADTIRLAGVDLSVGNTILDIDTEGTGVEGTGTPAANRTIAIRVNGAVRYLLASTLAS